MYKNFLSTGPGIGLTTIVGICAILGLAAFILHFTDKKEGYENQESKKFDKIKVDPIIKLYNKVSKKSDKNKIYQDLSVFDNIYCINLERSIERRENILNNIKNNNLHIITAVEGKDIFKDKNLYRYLYNNYTIDIKLNQTEDFKANTLGCTLSHLLAIYKAYVNNDNLILIIEDDIFIDILGIENINKYIDKIPDDYEFISLYTKCWPKSKFKPYTEYFNKTKQMCEGTLAYIINKKGIDKIVNKLIKADGNIINIDLSQYSKIFSDYIIPYELKSYVINKSIIIPSKEGFITTIDDPNTGNNNNTNYIYKDTVKRLKEFL